MFHLSKAQTAQFQKEILIWYTEHKRDLPWRKTRIPYHILISEIMLQQTQVSSVIPKFESWLKKFPTVQDLATASTTEVLALWSGLGYNRRALNLKKTARIVAEKYDGTFPQTEKELLALPGIGTYTARALLCFAFDQQVAVVDTNIKKVILTQFLKYRHYEEERRSNRLRLSLHDGDCRAPLAMTDKEINKLAEKLLPHGKAYEWNQALMDYSNAMLKNEKIPIPKQSKFVGSHRYYRGQVLKVLLEKKTVVNNELGKLIKADFSDNDQEWLEKLLEELVKEGFVVSKNDFITLSK